MSNKELSIKKLSKIIGGDAYNPGMNNWGSAMKEGSKTKGGNTSVGNKISTCILYGLTWQRGPFGCDS